MGNRVRRAASSRTLLIMVVLLAFSGSGFVAGTLTHGLVNAFAGHGISTTTTGTAPASRSSPSAAPTATDVPAVVITTAFTISVKVTPNHLTSGQTFTVVATALGKNHAPVTGLRCYLRAPQNDSNPFFQQWPAPHVTDATGQAQWSLTAPPHDPGNYQIEVVAYGQKWTSWADASMVLTG